MMGPLLKLSNLILCNANNILKWMNRMEMLLPLRGKLPSVRMYIADLPAFPLPFFTSSCQRWWECLHQGWGFFA